MRLSAPPITNGPRALVRKAPPNMRLKLAGLLLKESAVASLRPHDMLR